MLYFEFNALFEISMYFLIASVIKEPITMSRIQKKKNLSQE